MFRLPVYFFFFFFNDTATTEIYTLSLHDALPISTFWTWSTSSFSLCKVISVITDTHKVGALPRSRSEEHTSELQSQSNLVCRLLLEKKKKNTHTQHISTHHSIIGRAIGRMLTSCI